MERTVCKQQRKCQVAVNWQAPRTGEDRTGQQLVNHNWAHKKAPTPPHRPSDTFTAVIAKSVCIFISARRSSFVARQPTLRCRPSCFSYSSIAAPIVGFGLRKQFPLTFCSTDPTACTGPWQNRLACLPLCSALEFAVLH